MNRPRFKIVHRQRVRQRHGRRGLFGITALVYWLGASIAGADDPSYDGMRHFEKEIRPVLLEHCIACHGPQKSESHFRLDTRDGMIAGGDGGPPIDLDQPERSTLLSALRHEDLQMPPHLRLADRVIEEFETWIRNGAPWPSHSLDEWRQHDRQAQLEKGRSHWAFLPIQENFARSIRDPSRFIDDQLGMPEASSINAKESSAEADRLLLRRLYLDLVGIVPTWEEWQSYRDDPRPDRYSRRVNELLADPRYGEHWSQFWLDLVRYAESDGFKQDAYRPSAYRYRDWVIQSLNADLPYGQFVREQMAGDLIEPVTDSGRIATGFLRHWIYEYNQRDVASQLENILNDLTEVTGEVFLGLSFGCARCHDHKFDPIFQTDYYRLRACFATILPSDEWPASTGEWQQWQASLPTATIDELRKLREELNELEAAAKQDLIQQSIEKFPPEIRPSLRKAGFERTSRDEQLVYLANRQIDNELAAPEFAKRIPENLRERWATIKSKIAALEKTRPQFPGFAMSVRELSNPAELSHPWRQEESRTISPGIPLVLAGPIQAFLDTSSRTDPPARLQLAEWISNRSNPLTWRVIVNRVWQQYFGRGIVANASDFGRLSGEPLHKDLLDGLAASFVANGERLKELHRWIVHSETYRQQVVAARSSSTSTARDEHHAQRKTTIESEQHLNGPSLGPSRRRLTAEQMRDSMLAIAGELDSQVGGPSEQLDSHRRSIYLRVVRNTPHPLLSLFDRPDGSTSIGKRNATITPLQALAQMNSEWPYFISKQLATRVMDDRDSIDAVVPELFRRILLRDPDLWEMELAQNFVRKREEQSGETHEDGSSIPKLSSTTQPSSSWPVESRRAIIDLRHVLFCSNEFLYVE